MLRTLKFALLRETTNCRAVGYYATQQSLAYNAAVDVLNREPNLPKRSGKDHPDALNKRLAREIKRPVFSLLERGPLYEQCSFLSYESIDTLAEIPYLPHMSDTIVEEHEEFAEV